MDLLAYPFDSTEILRKKRSLKKELLQKPGLIDKKVAIVTGSTVGDFRPILELFLLQAGIRPEFFEGGYGLFYEDVVFGDALAAFAPDVLYIHTSGRNIRFWPDVVDSPEQAEQKLEDEYRRFETVWQAAQKLGCPVVQNNFELPAYRNFGSLDAQESRGRSRFVRRLNEKMAAYAEKTPGFYIHDWNYLASALGTDAFCDNSAWYAYKYACAPAYIPDVCHSLACLMKSFFGFVKKGLVLDLDNTLWGGVVGEVGPQGIDIGSENPQGMAYSEFQSYLAGLSRRGILLNVASKNEPAAAKSGFEREESVLKAEDFLCFEAGWGPKSESVERIAKTLNIGIDSLVFVDDNPAEREQVHGALPMVQAPAVGDIEHSIRLLDRSGFFEVSSLSADDAKRTQMYRQNAAREQEQASYANYEDYLRGLEMTAHITAFQPEQLERVTQLINKTNQFNLTTRRYSQSEVETIAQSAEYITLSGQLKDKFGDNGITSAIIGKITGGVLDIELWIMSCRVFKRHFEYAMFDALVAEAQKRGLRSITGSWLPTAKNLLVQDFYATIGFELTAESQQQRDFCLTLPQRYEPKNTVIEVE